MHAHALGKRSAAGSTVRSGQRQEHAGPLAAFLQELPAHGGKPPEQTGAPYPVEDLIADYLDHAEGYYRDPESGEPSGTLAYVKHALRHVLQSFAGLPAEEFSPLALRAARDAMLASGSLCRKTVNARVQWIKRAFKGASSMDLVSPMVAQGLATPEGLRPGGRRPGRASRCGRCPRPTRARTSSTCRRRPTTFGLAPVVDRDALRRGVTMRGRQIDRSGTVWIDRPEPHKTSWRGRAREIAIRPNGQKILHRYLWFEPDAFLFSPRRSEQERSRRAARSTPEGTAPESIQVSGSRAHAQMWFSSTLDVPVRLSLGKAAFPDNRRADDEERATRLRDVPGCL